MTSAKFVEVFFIFQKYVKIDIFLAKGIMSITHNIIFARKIGMFKVCKHLYLKFLKFV